MVRAIVSAATPRADASTPGTLQLRGGLDGTAEQPQLGGDYERWVGMDIPGVGAGVQNNPYGFPSTISGTATQASDSTGARHKYTTGALISNSQGRTGSADTIRIECGFTAWFKFQTGSNLAAQRLFIGFMNSLENEDEGTGRVCLRYSSVIGANFFFMTSTEAKVPTTVDTGVVVVADTIYVVKISAPVGGASISFELWNADETAILASGTIATNLPDITDGKTMRRAIITTENAAKHFYDRGAKVMRP